MSKRTAALRLAGLSCALAALILASGGHSQTAEDFSIRTKLLSQDIELERDGRFTRTIHTETLAVDRGGLSAARRLSVPFSQSMEELEIAEAYTRKPDGRKITVDPSTIIPEAAENITGERTEDDQKQMVVDFPEMEVGDVAVLTAVKRAKQTYFPGEFMHGVMFAPTVKTDEGRVTLKAPADLELSIETHGMTLEKEVSGGDAIYRWTLSAPAFEQEDEAVLSHWDRAPRVYISTFSDYDEFGAAYADVAAPKMAVTPEIQELADRLTAGISDGREQAKVLYDWVSRNVVYVARFLDKGRIVPREAGIVLNDRSGDCKDHAVLFGALLRAKGIDSHLVMVNLGNAYSLSVSPTLSQLNHVINYLPEFDLYADTTVAVAPFGTIPLEEHGKKVVHAVSSGGALRVTPLAPREAMHVSIKTWQRLLDDGRLVGSTTTSATGPLAVQLRQMGRSFKQAGLGRAAQAELSNGGFRGTGRFEVGTPEAALSNDYSITGRFDLRPRPQWVEGESFTPPPGLWLVTRPGGMFLGLMRLVALKETAETPCFSGTANEELSLELPLGKRVAALPPDADLKGAHFTYSSHWSLEGNIIRVTREFSTDVDSALCSGELRREAATALASIRKDYQSQIALIAAEASL
jgi:hypothetical protein